MRSGILFARVNQVWSSKKRVDWDNDGILTGWEISYLNLENNRLIVLSACYTGAGDIDYYEGGIRFVSSI